LFTPLTRLKFAKDKKANPVTLAQLYSIIILMSFLG
jgi:hypothetical protein